MQYHGLKISIFFPSQGIPLRPPSHKGSSKTLKPKWLTFPGLSPSLPCQPRPFSAPPLPRPSQAPSWCPCPSQCQSQLPRSWRRRTGPWGACPSRNCYRRTKTETRTFPVTPSLLKVSDSPSFSVSAVGFVLDCIKCSWNHPVHALFINGIRMLVFQSGVLMLWGWHLQ